MKTINYIVSFILRDIPIHIINLATCFLPNHMYSNRIRGFLIKPFLGSGGKKLQIGRGVIINNPGSLFIGDDCYLSHYCYIQAKGKVILGNNVIIGPMTILASSNHIFLNSMVINKGINKPITIGTGTFCGGNAVILSGVNIDQYVTIGAGAVVTNNVSINDKVVGIPARSIMS